MSPLRILTLCAALFPVFMGCGNGGGGQVPFVPMQIVDTKAGSSLVKSLPYYVKSVTLTLTENPRNPNDQPPPPTTAPPFVVTPVFNAAKTAIIGVTLPTVSIGFAPTFRTSTLTVQAWSQSDGTGEMLASGSVQTGLLLSTGSNPPVQEVTLVSNVKSFVLTPSNPTITLTTNPSVTGPGVNAQQMQVSAVVGAANVQTPIDPRALSYSINPPNVVTVTTLPTPVDNLGNPFALVSGTIQQSLVYPQNVTVTATDPVTAAQGANTVKVQTNVPGFIFH